MKRFTFEIRGNKYHTVIDAIEGATIRLQVNGVPYDVELEREVTKTPVLSVPKVVTSPVPSRKRTHAPGEGGIGTVQAPLPGAVLALQVRQGDTVAAGDVVAILEAMKMQNEIHAPVGGVVRSVDVAVGDTVTEGATLMTIGEA